jgi:hypothetical protein
LFNSGFGLICFDGHLGGWLLLGFEFIQRLQQNLDRINRSVSEVIKSLKPINL